MVMLRGLLGLLLLSSLVAVQSQGCGYDVNTTRLPGTVIPSLYELNFSVPHPDTIPFGESGKFAGVVAIDVSIKAPTTCIMLHSLVQISSSKLLLKDGDNLTAHSIQYVLQAGFVILSFPLVITPQNATLRIEFIGTFNNVTAFGFFLSDNTFDPSYSTRVTPDTVRRVMRKLGTGRTQRQRSAAPLKLTRGVRKMFATQFEATSARSAFPCFDEPAYKAIFKASVSIDFRGATPGAFALFNTPSVSLTRVGYISTWTFEATPHPMSTYLVAFAIGEFDSVSAPGPGAGHIWTVYTPPGAGRFGNFALNVAADVTEYFSTIFGLDYFAQMPKMDQISVPAIDEDAMENWGLLTYSPEFLLIDEDNKSNPLEAYQLIALVVTHEIAHQWFGDTVTTPWWNQIFLNEGYARFLQYVGVDFLFPKWEIFSKGGSNSYYSFAFMAALQADYTGLAPPIIDLSQNNGLPSVIQNDFSRVVSYGKGASVNFMLANYVGMNTWNKIMAYHLRSYQYTNPSIYNLFDSYNTFLQRDFTKQFSPYFFNTGFPLLKINLTEDVLTITQQPISQYGNPYRDSYWIPLRVSFLDLASNTTFELNLEISQFVSIVPLSQKGKWVVTPSDAQFTAYALINYDDNTWNYIFTHLPTYDSSIVVYILQSQQLLVHMNYLEPLTFAFSANAACSNLTTELDDALFTAQAIFDGWFPLSNVFRYESWSSEIADQLAQAVSGVLRLVGFVAKPQESPTAAQLRSYILLWGSYYGNYDVISTLMQSYEKGNIEANLKTAVYWNAAHWNRTAFPILLSLYKSTPPSSPDRATLLFALSATRSREQITELITDVIIAPSSNFDIATQLSLLSTIIQYNLECRDVAWLAYQTVAKAGFSKLGNSLAPAVWNDPLFAVFDTIDDFNSVQAFVKSYQQYISASQANALLTQIKINQALTKH